MSFWDDGQGAEYQRQQLNLMRRHQGLEPIPPPPYPENIMIWSFRMALRFMISFYGVFFAVAVFVHPFAGVAAGLACFLWLTRRRRESLRRQRARQLEAWRRAGCP